MPNFLTLPFIGAGVRIIDWRRIFVREEFEHLILASRFNFGSAHSKACFSLRLVRVDRMIRTLLHPLALLQERNIEYADLGIPGRMKDFCAYGRRLPQRFCPNLDNQKSRRSNAQTRAGFTLVT